MVCSTPRLGSMRVARCRLFGDSRLASAPGRLCLASVKPGGRSGRGSLDLDLARLIARPDLRCKREAAQQSIHRRHDIQVDGETVAGLDLDQHVEGRRGASFEDRLLRAAPARLFIRQGHRFDATDQVAQRRVEQQVVQGLTVRRADQLYAALGDRAGGGSLGFAPDLIDDDHFRVMVLHGLDHHLVLEHGLAHLHAPRLAHRRMRHVAVAADFIGCVHDHHTLGFGDDARRFAQQGGLAHARPAEDEHRFARFDNVLNDIDGAIDGAANAQGQTDDGRTPVADGRDPVQRPLDAGAIICIELTRAFVDIIDLGARHFSFAQTDLMIYKTRGGDSPQIKDDLEQVLRVVGSLHRVADVERKDIEKGIEIVCYF
jgi:hypothetical protein